MVTPLVYQHSGFGELRGTVDEVYHGSGAPYSTVGMVYHDSDFGAPRGTVDVVYQHSGELCGVRAAIEANLRCIDQSCFFQTFFHPFLQTD